MQNNYNRKESVVYAGFFVRMAAHLIDMAIVGILLLFARIPFAVLSVFLPAEIIGHPVLFSYTIKDIYLYLGGALYYILLTYYTGATLGKKLMNLSVVAEDGTKLTFFNVVYRETIGRFLCRVFWGIGYLMAGIDGQKRGLHDMICGTRVIYEKKVKVTVVHTGMPQGQYMAQNQSAQGNPVAYRSMPQGQRMEQGPMPQNPMTERNETAESSQIRTLPKQTAMESQEYTNTVLEKEQERIAEHEKADGQKQQKE